MENFVYTEIIAHLQHCKPGRPLISRDDEEYEIRASIVKWLLMPSSESCVQFTEEQKRHLIRELAATWSEVYFKLVLQALIEEDEGEGKGVTYLHPVMFQALQAQGALYTISTGFMLMDQWAHSAILNLLTDSKCRNMEFFLKTDLPLVLFRGVIYEYESRNHAYQDVLAMALVNSFIAVANMVAATTFRVPHEFLLKVMEVLMPLRRMKIKSEEVATRVLEATDLAFRQVKEATHHGYFFPVLSWVDLHETARKAVKNTAPEVPDRVWRYLKDSVPDAMDMAGLEEQVLLKKHREHLLGDFYLATECNMNLNANLKALWRRILCAMKGCGKGDDVTELLIEAIRLRQMRVLCTWGPSTKYLLAALLEANTRELTEQESREVGAILVKDKELLDCLMRNIGQFSRETLTLEKANSCFKALEKASRPEDCLLAKYRREEVFEYLDESYDLPQIERLRNLDTGFWEAYQEWCEKKHEAWVPPPEDAGTENDDDSTTKKVQLFREQVCAKRKATKSKHLNKRQRV